MSRQFNKNESWTQNLEAGHGPGLADHHVGVDHHSNSNVDPLGVLEAVVHGCDVFHHSDPILMIINTVNFFRFSKLLA